MAKHRRHSRRALMSRPRFHHSFEMTSTSLAASSDSLSDTPDHIDGAGTGTGTGAGGKRIKMLHKAEKQRERQRQMQIVRTKEPMPLMETNEASNKIISMPRINGHHAAFNEQNVTDAAKKIMQWMIWPVTVEQFFDEFFEKKPFVVHRKIGPAYKNKKITIKTIKHSYIEEYAWYEKHTEELIGEKASAFNNEMNLDSNTYVYEQKDGEEEIDSHYYEDWLSVKDIDSILKDPKNEILFTKDIDITQYKNGVRTTKNPDGRAKASKVWDFFKQGSSIRFIAPQKYSKNIWRLMNLLDQVFGIGTGANTYLTPADTQGFAAHYDDVDVLIMQTEGSKRWRLYPPRAFSEVLPQVSSGNFAPDEIGEPVMDVWLEAGDFLYAPRGTIHQCVAHALQDSLHVTLSTGLKSTWADYLLELFGQTVRYAFNHELEYRKSLPLGYKTFMGLQHTNIISDDRNRFIDESLTKIKKLVADDGMLQHDGAADYMALDFLAFRVPPYTANQISDVPSFKHLSLSRRTGSSTNSNAAAAVMSQKFIKESTRVRMVQPGVCRIIMDDDTSDLLQLHHCLGNSKEHRGEPLQILEFSLNFLPSLRLLLRTHPLYVAVNSIPLGVEEDDVDSAVASPDTEADFELKRQLVATLFEEGLLEMSNSTSHEDSVHSLLNECGDDLEALPSLHAKPNIDLGESNSFGSDPDTSTSVDNDSLHSMAC